MEKEIIWLIRGNQRKIVFLNLPEIPFLSNRLRKELNEKLGTTLSLREVSRHMRDFEEMCLIKCINKTDLYNRIYEMTKKGKKIIGLLNKVLESMVDKR